jgi:cellulose synthase/poly-beta-1,6-N-acetylglucosamine synthase-like glycosyltransferase
LSLSAIVIPVVAAGLLFYLLVHAGLVLGLLRTAYPKNQARPFVSVIVAARDEEASIGKLLDQLVRQDYPAYEILIVDDRSTDSTAAIVQSYQHSHSNLRLVSIRENNSGLPPKKNALTEGIKHSEGAILCFTDADCVPPPSWILELVSVFDDSVGFVAGFSPYDRNLLTNLQNSSIWRNIFYSFIAYEEFRGAAWSAGAIGMNLAWLCTGRSIAYRKRVFDEVRGFEQIKMSISGDDDLFIQLVRRQTFWKIRYACAPESFVRTAPPESFSKFVEQRKRHFSAGKYFSLPMKGFFFGYHSLNLLFLLVLCSAFFSNVLLPIGLWAVGVKLLADGILAIVAGARLRQGYLASRFPLMEILYILYNSFIGPIGFLKSFEWKQDKKTA